MNSAIEVRGLCKHYRDFSLRDVSFTVPGGSIMGFIGENGAGKTTACCTRMEAPSRYWGATLSRTAAPSGRISALCWTAAFSTRACARRISRP